MDAPDRDPLLDRFADGELDPATHAEELERLRSDAEAQAHAAEVTRLKDALAASFSREQAPDELEARVRASLDDVAKRDSRGARLPASAWSSSRAMPFLAAAACLVLAFGLWQWWPSAPRVEVHVRPIAANRLSSATDAHRSLIADLADRPEDALLQSDRHDAQRFLSGELGLPVQAPDLTHAGFAFVGSRHCTIERMPGAQLVYRHEASGRLLSLFTASRLEHLRTSKINRDIREVFAAEPDEYTTLAWHVDGATCLACASLPKTELLTTLGMGDAIIKAAWRRTVDVPSAASLASRPWDRDRVRRQPLETANAGSADASRADPRPRRSARGISAERWIALLKRAIVMG